jgi:hypothetical protein
MTGELRIECNPKRIDEEETEARPEVLGCDVVASYLRIRNEFNVVLRINHHNDE